MYNRSKWDETCVTCYNKTDPSSGVLCRCDHNTSFAVIMVSRYHRNRKQIDVGFFYNFGTVIITCLLTVNHSLIVDSNTGAIGNYI